MTIIVGRKSTDIDSNFTVVNRFEFFFLLGVRVVDKHRINDYNLTARPGIPKRNSAIKDRSFGRRINWVNAKITFSFELKIPERPFC